jgi:hypothetical protein
LEACFVAGDGMEKESAVEEESKSTNPAESMRFMVLLIGWWVLLVVVIEGVSMIPSMCTVANMLPGESFDHSIIK